MREDNERIGVLRHLQDTRKPGRWNANITSFAPIVSVARGITYGGRTHDHIFPSSSRYHETIGSVFLLVMSALGRSPVT